MLQYNSHTVQLMINRVSVQWPIAIDILMDTMARNRVHMCLFSVSKLMGESKIVHESTNIPFKIYTENK